MRLNDCHNFQDFRKLAKRRLPGTKINDIDDGADDDVTLSENTLVFERCELLPSVFRGESEFDMSDTVMGQRLDKPIHWTPTALQRLLQHKGEHALGMMCANCVEELERDDLRLHRNKLAPAPAQRAVA